MDQNLNTLMKVPKALDQIGNPCSPKLVFAAIRKSECRAVRIGTGRHVRTTPAWVLAYLNARASGPAPTSTEQLRQSA